MISKNIKIISVIGLCVIVFIISIFSINIYKSKKDIDYIINKEEYSYLPLEAKNYIREVYEETGNIILTEKNKEENKPYLNPRYIEYLMLPDEEKAKEGDIPVSIIIDYNKSSHSSKTLPTSFDLRNVNEKNYVTPVRDQGNLGLCWTFASVGAAESFLLKSKDESYSSTAQLLSERQIDYATSINGIKDYKSEYVSFIEDRALGDGGNFYISSIAMANGISLVDYKNFKEYDDSDMSKMELSEVLSYSNSSYELNESIHMPILNLRESTGNLSSEDIEIRSSFLNEVKENLINYGAAYVSTNVSSACTYTDSNLNSLVVDVYSCSTAGGSHAMQIIGWDDNIEYTYCNDNNNHKADLTGCKNVVKGKGVWILKNSWGDSDQYPYLSYDSLNTGIYFIKNMTYTSERIWDNNYIIGLGRYDVSFKDFSLANTRIKGQEIIKKIKFISNVGDLKYQIDVVDSEGNTISNTLYVDNPGLNTFVFNKDVYINQDSIITIIASGNNGLEYIDKISVFTSNVDEVKYISLEELNNKLVDDLKNRIYLDTKNISSGDAVIFKLYNENGEDVSNSLSYENNNIAENNLNLILGFDYRLDTGIYRLDALYNNDVISSANIMVNKMEGSGTEEDPYVIKTPEHLNQIRNDVDAYYVLGNDIDLTIETREGGKYYNKLEYGGGHGWESIKKFSGTLDGKGYSIKGLYQRAYTSDDIGYSYMMPSGLFGTATGNVTIKNLTLENFDIECSSQSGYSYCAPLLSMYYTDSVDYEKEQHVLFENIAVKNSKIVGKRWKADISVGGVFGYFRTSYNINNTLTIKNIYSDSLIYSDNSASGLLAGFEFKNSIINNIQLLGSLNSKDKYGYIFLDEFNSNGVNNTSNVFSTYRNNSIISFNGYSVGTLKISDVNLLKISDSFYKNIKSINNLNVFDIDINSYELTNRNNYNTWENFDDNFVIKTVDGIPRYPVLKFVDFEYTKIDDIVINQELNKKYSIYDYIYPQIDAAKNISFKSNDESIVRIDENGFILPQKTGSTTIHIESFYDGYINDVPITITYVPHFTIHFDNNDVKDYYGDISGNMNSIEVEVGQPFILPANKFTQEYYEFKEWNTKSDGSGTSYSDLSTLMANDKEEITLYVQWWGKERIVTFDPAGGMVTPDTKIVRIRENYGELPIPTRSGYGFVMWDAIGSSNYVDSFQQLREFELAAIWKEDAYTIIYDANGGNISYEDYRNLNVSEYFVSDTLATSWAKNNQEETIAKNFYKKSGYVFKEWNTKFDGTGVSYSELSTINLSNVENDMLRLYAIWENQSISVTFDANEGKFGEKTVITVDNWQNEKLESLELPTRDGYIFKGYYTERTGGISLENYIIENGISKSGLVFYAQWDRIKYILKYDSNGGTGVINEQEFVYNTYQKLIKNTFLKSGYKFKEWNTKSDGSGISYSDEAEIKLNANLTIYAIWEEDYTYIINNYSLDESGKCIDLISPYTTVDNFKKNIKLNNGFSVQVDYKIVDGKNLLYTGSKTKIYKNKELFAEYTNIVRGDVNGNATIDIIDYIRIMKHIMEEI